MFQRGNQNINTQISSSRAKVKNINFKLEPRLSVDHMNNPENKIP